MSIGNAFNESVDYYDNWMKKAIPSFDEVFSIATEVIPFGSDKELRVLDLGAGTGLFSEFIYRAYPQSTFVLIDLAEKMLQVAQERFKDSNNFTYRVGDYTQIECLDLGTFDLVISSLSIHHLAGSEKKKLFKDTLGLLNEGGAFINIDQIKAPTNSLSELYWKRWLEKTRIKGGTESEIESSVKRRKEYDKDDTLFDQLDWMNQAEFSDVDCLYKNYFIGIFHGLK